MKDNMIATVTLLAFLIPASSFGLSFHRFYSLIVTSHPFGFVGAFPVHTKAARQRLQAHVEHNLGLVCDETVAHFRHDLLQVPSTDEATSFACKVGTPRHKVIRTQEKHQHESSSSTRLFGQDVWKNVDRSNVIPRQDRTIFGKKQSMALHPHRWRNGIIDSVVLSQFILRRQQLLRSFNRLGLISASFSRRYAEFSRALIVRSSDATPPATVSLSLSRSLAAGVPLNLKDTVLYKKTVEGGSPGRQASSDHLESLILASFGVSNSTVRLTDNSIQKKLETSSFNKSSDVDHVDIAIVGAGISGLCAGAILNTVYGKKVGVYESHYIAGGCAHAFDRVASNNVTFTFDSGPTIVLGCSQAPYNPLRQVLNAVGQSVEWIRYDGWGMIENPGRENERRWKVSLGADVFQEGPIIEFGSNTTLLEFEKLRELTKDLVSGAVEIPAMAMRAGKYALIPLLRYIPALIDILRKGEEATRGTFKPYIDGPVFVVTDPWLRSWLDALAFSLSGLSASRTSAAAMAYVLYDMHRPDAALDYPRGGLGEVINALVRGVEQGNQGSKVNLSKHVESIDTTPCGGRVTGLSLRGGKKVVAKEGVISTVPIWLLNSLIINQKAREVLDDFMQPGKDRNPRQSWITDGETCFLRAEREPIDYQKSSFLLKCDTAEMTGSFLHLHLAIRSDGLDLEKMEAHYTVMDRSLSGSPSKGDGPCGELNMIAVSNPCVIDDTLAPRGYMVLHAYGAANEPYSIWKDLKRGSKEYEDLKTTRSEVLWRAVESIIPDVRDRVVLDLVGSPLTHERFLRRPKGTYGAATEDYLRDGSTPFETLVLAGEAVFPGIGVPAVALSGAAGANAMISPKEQWAALDKLKQEGLL